MAKSGFTRRSSAAKNRELSVSRIVQGWKNIFFEVQFLIVSDKNICATHTSDSQPDCVRMEDQIYLGVMDRAPDGRLVFRRVISILK